MLLSDLCESVRDTINSSPQEVWQEYVAGVDFTAKCKVDPTTDMKGTGLKVFVVPMVVEYNPEEATGRRFILQSSNNLVVRTVIMKGYESVSDDGDDVTSWEEGKKVVNLRQCLDRLLVHADWGKQKVTEVLPVPPEELAQDMSFFISITDFSFEQVECMPEANSTLRGLQGQSVSGSGRQSIRSLTGSRGRRRTY